MRMLEALLVAAIGAGCATTTGDVQHSASDIATPRLVAVEPGVAVVADDDDPVFYSEGFYWRYDAGAWFRSRYYDRAWVSVPAPPIAVLRINRPEHYAHYHEQAPVREARVTPMPSPQIK